MPRSIGRIPKVDLDRSRRNAPEIEPSEDSPPDVISFADEITRYERSSQLGVWEGPRYRMTYRVHGEGPPLLVIQGLASTYRGYAPMLNRLGSRFRTIVYDYPGEDPRDGAILGRIAHRNLVEDALGLLDYLSLDRVAVFAASFGSTIALGAAIRAGDRFHRVAIQGGFARRPLTRPERLALRCGRILPGTMERLPLRRPVLSWHNRSAFPPECVADRWPVFVAENGRTRIAGMAHRLDLLAEIDLRPELSRVPRETLLIQGEADRIVPWPAFEELRSHLPRAVPEVWPGVGHQPHFTHPERLAASVARFLQTP